MGVNLVTAYSEGFALVLLCGPVLYSGLHKGWAAVKERRWVRWAS